MPRSAQVRRVLAIEASQQSVKRPGHGPPVSRHHEAGLLGEARAKALLDPRILPGQSWRHFQVATETRRQLSGLLDEIRSFWIELWQPGLQVPDASRPRPLTVLERSQVADMELHGDELS